MERERGIKEKTRRQEGGAVRQRIEDTLKVEAVQRIPQASRSQKVKWEERGSVEATTREMDPAPGKPVRWRERLAAGLEG